jgi:hypothetical protein
VSADARLFIIDVGPEQRDNLSVSSLTQAAPTLSAEWPVTLLAEVANHSQREASDLQLQALLNDQVLRTERVPSVPPNEARAVRFRLQLPGPGSHQIQTRLIAGQPDALPRDDVRWLPISVRQRVPILLVDGRPGADRFAGQTGYLATALAPKVGPADPALVHPRVIMSGELPAEPLETYAAIALCNVRQLGQQVWNSIDRYVRRGGGLLIYMGDQVSMDDYNRFGFVQGQGILPARLVGLSGREKDRETFVRIRAEGLQHPIAADFAGQPRSGLFLARVYRYARVEVPQDLDGADVVLHYDNGDCAIASRHVDQGRVALVTFSANMDWTNLPAKGDYVSLTLSLLAWAVGERAANRTVTVGEPLMEALTDREASLAVSVVEPDGRRRQPVLTSQPAAGGVVVRYDGTNRAGRYKLMVGQRPIDFGVNVDPAEGNLTPITPQALRESLACEFGYARQVDKAVAATAGTRREIGWLLVWIVLGLLAAETLLAMWFGHHRE